MDVGNKHVLVWLCASAIQWLGVAQANEAFYQEEFCVPRGGIMEYVLPDNTRVDCLLTDYAVEVDYAKKWSEAVGQSLYYSEETGLKPGIALIVDKNDYRFVERLITTMQAVNAKIKVWFIPK